MLSGLSNPVSGKVDSTTISRSQKIQQITSNQRALCLVGDGFGGRGGIAKFNRDFLNAITSHPGYREVVAFPRLQPDSITEHLPSKLCWDIKGLGGKANYVLNVIQGLFRDRRYNIVVCGLINMLPLAWIVSTITRAPLLLVIHGVDAWQPHRSKIVNRLLRKVDYVIAVSETTKQRFAAWSNFPVQRIFILPNCIDTILFQPMPKNPELLKRYGLEGRKVLMTLARLDSRERYKGIDHIIDIMPELLMNAPSLTYLIVGGGNDLSRLAEKVNTMGLSRNVTFTDYIPEDEKVDHYNIADVFAMPGWGEGFGIVYLEAMACGVPVVGSVLDGSKDALRDGKLGVLVDPHDSGDVLRGILKALNKQRGVPLGLEYFSYVSYEKRLKELLDQIALNALMPPA